MMTPRKPTTAPAQALRGAKALPPRGQSMTSDTWLTTLPRGGITATAVSSTASRGADTRSASQSLPGLSAGAEFVTATKGGDRIMCLTPAAIRMIGPSIMSLDCPRPTQLSQRSSR